MRVALMGAALAAGFMGGIAHVVPADAADKSVEWHACKAEDGSGQKRCVWDGRHMGNGEGKSLLIRNGGTDDMTVTVIRHRRAHRLAGI